MSSRGTKRKRYSDIKNMLVNDLHKLTLDSADFNNDLTAANDDFVLFFKSMEDRQSVLLSRCLILEEKYREITTIIKEGPMARVSEESSENVELPPTYSSNTKKFIDDSTTSLRGHGGVLQESIREMVNIFEKYGDTWNKKLVELEAHAEKIEEEREKLGGQLTDYKNNT